MPTPTAETFKARFPEFAPVSNALVDLILAEAIAAVGTSWIERDRSLAQMYLTAHKLAMEGEPGRSSGGGSSGATGPVKRVSVGDTSVEFAGSGDAAAGSTNNYHLTSYGMEYYRLMRRNFPTVAVV